MLIQFFRKKGGVDAEELTQQTWCRVVVGFDQYDPARNFKSWLFAIAYYEWVNALRARGKAPVALKAEPEAQPEEVDDRVAKLEECIKQLSPDERRIVYWRYWQGLRLDVIAERVETSYGRLKGVAYRAGVKLRKCMQQQE